MAQLRTGLLAGIGKYPAKPRAFNYIRLELVFRGPRQECAQNANEISALGSKLVFREIPGKLVQWRPQPQWFRRWVGLRRALLESVGRRVIRVPAPPPRLGLLSAFRLALWLSADVLPLSYSWVRPKPPPADCAGPLPGIGHVDLFIGTTRPGAFRSRGWVGFGEYRWVGLAERRRSSRPQDAARATGRSSTRRTRAIRGSRSQKILRGHQAWRQQNRPTVRHNWIEQPCQGRSCK